MKHLPAALFVVMLLALGAQPARAQTLDDGAVETAIKSATAKKYAWDIAGVTVCTAGVGFGGGMAAAMAGGVQPTGSYAVYLANAAGRIGFAAQHAKRLYKAFVPADATAEMRDASVVSVILEPHQPERSQNVYEVPSPVEHMVLRVKDNPATPVQPATFNIAPVEWGNLMGGKIQGTSATGTFPLSALRELPAGDLEAVLVTQAGERKCKIGAKDRAKVF